MDVFNTVVSRQRYGGNFHRFLSMLIINDLRKSISNYFLQAVANFPRNNVNQMEITVRNHIFSPPIA